MSRILSGLLCMLVLLPGAARTQTRDMSSSGVALDRVIAIVNEGVVLQSHLLKDRLVTTVGIRKDRTFNHDAANPMYTFGPDGITGLDGDALSMLTGEVPGDGKLEPAECEAA